MFDKYKDRYQKFEADHEAVRKVRIHLEKNGKVYLAGAGSAAAILVFKNRPQVTNIINTVAPEINNVPVFSNTVNNGGHMRKIVRCIETDEMWPSMSKAAEAIGVSIPAMSKHINGHTENLVSGMHFVIEGLATG